MFIFHIILVLLLNTVFYRILFWYGPYFITIIQFTLPTTLLHCGMRLQSHMKLKIGMSEKE